MCQNDSEVLILHNPYATPESVCHVELGLAGLRADALRRIRQALLILLLPAFYNFICFNLLVAPLVGDVHTRMIYWVFNGMGFIVIATAVWFLGLRLLELLTVVLHKLFGRKATLENWNAALYEVLLRGPLLAVLGAIVWAIWVVAYYHLNVGFYMISVPTGIAGNLLAACLYVPLLYRWYALERTEVTA